MQDVARRAGVAPMTVSNVVNGHPHVREATRARVLEAIAELGYHLNTAARSLRQGRTGVIGLAISDFSNAYFGLLAGFVAERAAAHGYEVLVEQIGQRREGEVDAIARSRLRKFDGLILHSTELADRDSAMLRSSYPIVVMGERAYSDPIDHVSMGNEDGALMATRHLIERGCRRIALIGGRHGAPDDIDVSTQRTRGYLRALDEHGIDRSNGLVLETPLHCEGGRSSAHAVVEHPGGVDGIFCATDEVAIGTLRALYERGIRVPNDIKVIGFDAIPVGSYTAPSLSTVEPDHEGMADAAVRLLIERLQGDRPEDEYREIVGGARLLIRESTAVSSPF
ncbi:LacI family DNA-binding transcriptional regulator [Glycomyces xiaoerkulensis]|uniref:LacI family DNA-binding transcriptional regulator n=1 Tax=Glycomyces xiaoerkulensis TaxID=2038139 RepID=UPI00130006AA|nr:LacI family DNA-binding transcriptional regulator [Glycomyces xiaoerkulensis]